MERKKRKISIRTLYTCIIIVFVVLGAVGLTLVILLQTELSRLEKDERNYTDSLTYAEQIRQGSDDLTDSVQAFVMSKDTKYFIEYFKYLNVEKTRDNAISHMRDFGLTDEENVIINEAMSYSEELTNVEIKAMRYVLAYDGYTDMASLRTITGSGFTDEAREKILSYDLVGSSDTWVETAYSLVFGDEYRMLKTEIDDKIDLFNSTVTVRMEKSLEESFTASVVMLGVNIGLILLMLVGMGVVLIVIYTMLVGPIKIMKNYLNGHDAGGAKQEISGAAELNYIYEHYNKTTEDIEEQKQRLEEENDMYRRKSEHDYLTNLLNREALDEYLGNKFSDKEHIPPFILYMLDVDDFKKVNDTYGHDAGDCVLKNIAAVFKNIAVKHNGLAARYGGEEFIITAEMVGEEDVDAIANEILETVRAMRVDCGEGVVLSVTVSIGSCFSLTVGCNERSIVQFADGAMYKSKARGKNCHNRFKYLVS